MTRRSVVGKGPSETSVNIQNNVLSQGSKVLIEGSVLDISSGTQQDEQIARFPDGVPAVSDKSQTGWMEYVYMQKPRPTDTVGVDVTFTAVDPNGNVATSAQQQLTKAANTASYGNQIYLENTQS